MLLKRFGKIIMTILPNWHPVLVHFTISLVSISVFFYILYYAISYFTNTQKRYVLELEIVARWCLWLGVIITIFTVSAGFYAYNTVEHDAPSHEAMTIHRNFAAVTFIFLIFIGLFSGWLYYKGKKKSLTLIVGLLIIQILLTLTAWRGGELVYRYGLGVLSLPKSEESKQLEEKNKHQHDENEADKHDH